MSKNLKQKVDEILLQFAEKESQEEKQIIKKEEKNMSEIKKRKMEKKEKKFGERFGKHFAESSKEMHQRMCTLEETVKSHGESVSKILEMAEKHFTNKEEKK